MASLLVFLVLGASTTTLIRLIGQAGAIVLVIGVLLGWLTLSIVWSRLRAYIFPYLIDPSSAPDRERP